MNLPDLKKAKIRSDKPSLYKKVENIHQDIFKMFCLRTNLDNDKEGKRLFIEVINSLIKGKQDMEFPLEEREAKLQECFKKLNGEEDIINVYEKYREEMMETLLTNWQYFAIDDLLKNRQGLKRDKKKELN